MPWYSFVQYFTDISICQLFNTRTVSTSRRYHESIYYGEWTTNGVKRGAPDYLAGGCFNFSTFCNNPQFLLNVYQTGEIMFALTQREPNEGSKRRDPYVTIGIHVMKVENNRSHRIHQAMTPQGVSDYAGARSVFLHLRDVPAGRYIAIPTTFAPKEQTTFMLRIYSDRKIETRELTEHAPSEGLFGCKHAVSVIRITIVEASLEQEKEVNAYCILKCGKQEVRTNSVKGKGTIPWNEQFVFHKSPHIQNFEVEIWNDCLMARDQMLAKSTFAAQIDNDTRGVCSELEDICGSSLGQLKLIVAAFDDPLYL